MNDKKDAYDSPCQRKWTRIKTNGVVALTSLDKPVVSIIYDIAEGGLSFLHGGETDVIDDEFRMDILIFDSMIDFEYHISKVRGRVKERQRITDPKNNVPVWRYHVEFLYLNEKKSQLLQIFCDPAGTATPLVM